jgi:hypothetical protein
MADSRFQKCIAAIRDGRFEISEIQGGDSRWQIPDFRDEAVI